MTRPQLTAEERMVVASPYGEPVTTLEELDALDEDEIVEGFSDGFDNAPQPSGNRSKSYWHGWRNGMVDAGHAEKDDAMATLAKAWVARNRLEHRTASDDTTDI